MNSDSYSELEVKLFTSEVLKVDPLKAPRAMKLLERGVALFLRAGLLGRYAVTESKCLWFESGVGRLGTIKIAFFTLRGDTRRRS